MGVDSAIDGTVKLAIGRVRVPSCRPHFGRQTLPAEQCIGWRACILTRVSFFYAVEAFLFFHTYLT